MAVDVVMPQMGESIFEGTITNSSSSGNPTAITKVGTGAWTLSGVNPEYLL